MERVDAAIKQSVDPNTHPVAVNINREPAHGAVAIARISQLPNIRADYGLALGDTIQNFRAALDHLAWCLVKGGDDPRPNEPQRVYFPMARSGQTFDNRIDEWLPGVGSPYRAIIRRYQPYRRGDPPKAIRWLRNLSNMDKHRVLIPPVVSLGPVNLQVTTNWPIRRMDPLISGHRALKVGTPLLRVSMIPVLGTDCQMHVNGNLACFPSLGYGIEVDKMLASIRSTVLEVLSTFDEMLV
jgi:hypothetical protein